MGRSFEASNESESTLPAGTNPATADFTGSIQEIFKAGKPGSPPDKACDTDAGYSPEQLRVHELAGVKDTGQHLHVGLNHLSVKVKTQDGYDNRGYDVYVPKNYDGKAPVPMMMILHGVAGGGTASLHLMETDTGMDKLADEKNMIVVYPWAKPNDNKLTVFGHTFHAGQIDSWNSPGAGLSTTEKGYDDVDYIKGILSQLHASQGINVDRSRQYIAGFSEGAEFAQHVVGRLPGEFAGIGSVHGTLLGTEQLRAPGKDPMPYVGILSDSDHMLPIEGGRGLMTTFMTKVSDSQPLNQFKKAAEADSCVGQPTVEIVEHVQITQYQPEQCGGYPVTQYVIKGGWRGGIIGGIIGHGDSGPAEHAWDGPQGYGWPLIGEKNRHIDDSRLLAEALLKYRRHEGTVNLSRKFKDAPTS